MVATVVRTVGIVSIHFLGCMVSLRIAWLAWQQSRSPQIRFHVIKCSVCEKFASIHDCLFFVVIAIALLLLLYWERDSVFCGECSLPR